LLSVNRKEHKWTNDFSIFFILRYFFFKQNPCSRSPCFNNGTCQVGYTAKDFRCKCLPGFTGELCKGKSEILTKETCSNPSGTARACILRVGDGENKSYGKFHQDSLESNRTELGLLCGLDLGLCFPCI